MRTLFRDGRIYSPDAPDGSAILVDDALIAWVGDEDGAESIAQAGGRGLAVVDLAGALVTPAFVDARVNLTEAGLRLTSVDLRGAASLVEALDLVDRAARSGRGRPILGGGWDEMTWPERRTPTARELDRAGYGGTTVLLSLDGERALASTPVLREIGRGAPTVVDASSVVSGERLGQARAAAMRALLPAQRRAAQRGALAAAAAAGIGGIHLFASDADPVDLVTLSTDADAADGRGTPLAALYWSGTPQDASEHDASPTMAGVALRVEDLDDAELAQRIELATANGRQLALDVRGADSDRLNRVLLILRAAAQRGGIGFRGAGHRLEHLAGSFVDPATWAELGLLATIQAHSGVPLAALAAAGVPLSFGSDAPFEDPRVAMPHDVERPFDPWAAVRAAAHRAPGTAISPRAAIAAHTRGGWRSARQDRDGAGVLRVGAPAHLAIWAAGALTSSAPDERVSRWSTDERAGLPALPDLLAALPRCLRTVVAGRTAFDSDELA